MIIFISSLPANEDAQTLSLKVFDGTILSGERKSDFAQTHFSITSFRFDFEEAFSLGRKKAGPPRYHCISSSSRLRQREPKKRRPNA
jgi:hypothetical protein